MGDAQHTAEVLGLLPDGGQALQPAAEGHQHDGVQPAQEAGGVQVGHVLPVEQHGQVGGGNLAREDV